MISFALSVPAPTQDHVYLHSHMLAVRKGLPMLGID